MADVEIAILSGPTASAPAVTSDPPLEMEANTTLTYDVIIEPETLGAATITGITVVGVGDLPPGFLDTPETTFSGTGPYTVSLTSAGLVTRPPDVFYTFGLQISVTYSTAVVHIGYQPVTLRVRAIGASN
jgi:hypothetical protein